MSEKGNRKQKSKTTHTIPSNNPKKEISTKSRE